MKKKNKGKQTKFHEIKIPILNSEYWVVVIWGDLEKSMEYIKKYTDGDICPNEEYMECRGLTFSKISDYPLIWIDINNPLYLATLAHESIHAVNYIFEYIKEESRSEVFAHSVGAIMRVFLNYQNKCQNKK